MHKLQIAILNLSKRLDLGAMSLRQIAKLIGVDNRPQIVKHHLLQLGKAGLMQVNLDEGIIKPVKRGFSPSTSSNLVYSLPIVGSANCGPATVFADQRIEGYLKVSSSMLPRKKQDLYVLVADGPSMNQAEVRAGVTINDGDYVIVDKSNVNPKNQDIVVAVIDDMATIKRYKEDRANGRIVLEAESTDKFLPIFIHEGDDFVISGKVIDVIKKSN